jgi:hypothetical protein
VAQSHPGASIALQNAIFDEFMGLVEARIDAARQAGTLDLGLETIAVEEFTILSDTLLRTIRHRARPPICWNWKLPEP